MSNARSNLSESLDRTRNSLAGLARSLTTPVRAIRGLFSGQADRQRRNSEDLPREEIQLAEEASSRDEQEASSRDEQGASSRNEQRLAAAPMRVRESDDQDDSFVTTRASDRRLTTIQPVSNGIPTREVDRIRHITPAQASRARTAPPQSALRSSIANGRDQEIIHSAVAASHITEHAAEIILGASDIERQLSLRRLAAWQNKAAVQAFTKRNYESIPPKDMIGDDEPLFPFLRRHASSDIISGFVLQTMRPVCNSDEEHALALLMRDCCTETYYQELCQSVFLFLERRMPTDKYAFTHAMQTCSLSSEQIEEATRQLASKYTVSDTLEASRKKLDALRELGRALDRRGLDQRLREITEASDKLSRYGVSLGDADTYTALMQSLRSVPRNDEVRGEYRDLAIRASERTFATSSELIALIRQTEHTFMSEDLPTESVFVAASLEKCTYCHSRGHTYDVCRKRMSAQAAGTSAAPRPSVCWNCGLPGHKSRACKAPRQASNTPAQPAAGGETVMLAVTDERCYSLAGAVSAHQKNVLGIFALRTTQPTSATRSPGQRWMAPTYPDAVGTPANDIAAVGGHVHPVQVNEQAELNLSLYSDRAGDEDLALCAMTHTSNMLHAIQADVVDKSGFTLADVQDKTLFLLQEPPKDTRVIIDNGCTCSVTNRLDMIKNVTPCSIGFQGVGRGTAELVGEAAFQVLTTAGTYIDCPPGLRMAYMPGVPTILSYHQLKELGWHCDLLSGMASCNGVHHVRIVNENRLDYMHAVPTGDTDEKLLLLEHNLLPDSVEHHEGCFLLTPAQLHALVGHAGPKALMATLRKMTDIDVGDVSSMDFSAFCHECTMGKMHNARKGCGLIQPAVSAKHPCHAIAVDFMGPFKASTTGLRYALAGVDYKSDYGWVECVKGKDDAYDAVERLLRNARALTGYSGSIQVINDNEPVMKCAQFDEMLKANGAVRIGTIEYEHRSNGRIERHNQKLQQVARCALAQSGLVPALWPLTMKYSQEILNRTVQKDGMAPIEKFCDKPPRAADLAIFGALVYFAQPQEHREAGKLAQRAGVGVYVGPAAAHGKSNGVAVLVQTANGTFKVVYAASVKYDNNVFPFRHGLQETLTSRQYRPVINALRGTAELDLDYATAPTTDAFTGTKYDLLGRSVRMLAKGRTRFGKHAWFGKITDIIQDDSDPANEAKTMCRIFFQPSAEHTEGAYQNIPIRDARGLLVENETAALILDCMDQRLLHEQVYMLLATTHQKNTFTSLKKAMQQPDAAELMAAYDVELANFREHNVCEYGTPTSKDIIARFIPLLSRKVNHLKGTNYKTRIVIDGSDLPDEHNSFAPVARIEGVISGCSVITGLGLHTAQADTSSAYLHAPAPRPIYARPLPGMEDPTGTHKYVKLLKAVYGEHAAGKAYFGFHIDIHLAYGFQKVTRDSTILIFRTTVVLAEIETTSILLLVTIVDDSLLGYQHREVADKYFEYLASKAKIVVSFEPKVFVGLEIDYDQAKGVMRLGQSAYIHKIAQQFGINKEDASVTCPWKEGETLELAESDPDPRLVTKVRSLIGAIAWVSNATRKDVLAPLRTASRVMHRPKPELLDSLLQLLQWLYNKRTRTLTFRREGWVTLDGTKIAVNQIAAFVDSSYANAGPQFQMKSQYGYALLMNGACIAAGSGLGPHPVDSSSYAEVVALHVASKDILYLMQIVDIVCAGNLPPRPIVFEDNTTAIAVMTNNKSATRSRHFDIKYFYMADLIQRGMMVIQHVSTEHQVADMLTKPTSAAIFQRLSKRLMGED